MARPVARRPHAAALPEWVPPQLTQLVDTAPEGDQWLHEIKFDGYRMHAPLHRGAVRLLTRTEGAAPRHHRYSSLKHVSPQSSCCGAGRELPKNWCTSPRWRTMVPASLRPRSMATCFVRRKTS
jgi:hypothetical protein